MISMDTEHLVEDYLRQLTAAAAVLPSERRAELVSEIRCHVADSLRDADAVDEADVRNVLERLGTPEEIVAAAIDAPPTAPGPGSRFGTLEVAAVLILGLGGLFFPFVGWIVGAILVWMSGAWSRRDKLIATLPLAAVPLLVLGARFAAGPTAFGLGPVEALLIAGTAIGVFGGVLAAIYLSVRLQVATRAELKRRNVLKIALVIALAGLVFLLVAGFGVVVARGPSDGAAVSTAVAARAPITSAQYDGLTVGAITLAEAVARLGDPLLTCSPTGCKGPGGGNAPLGGVISVHVPVGQQCLVYNVEDTESVYTLCFDGATGKLLTKRRS